MVKYWFVSFVNVLRAEQIWFVFVASVTLINSLRFGARVVQYFYSAAAVMFVMTLLSNACQSNSSIA